MLGLELEALTARDEQLQAIDVRKARDVVGKFWQQVLRVVKEDEQLLAGERRSNIVCQ